MIFKDREDAAYQLLKKLGGYRGKNVIVAGVPRGAMPMAKIIADGLGAELTGVLVHKIPHPNDAEYAIGSVGLSGNIYRLPNVKYNIMNESYIQNTANKQLEILKARQHIYGFEKVDMQSRTVIIVDDGIATGSTIMSAISEVRSFNPSKIILAVGVSSHGASEKIAPLVEEFIALDIPTNFHAVAQSYIHFPQVTDNEIVELLNRENRVNI